MKEVLPIRTYDFGTQQGRQLVPPKVSFWNMAVSESEATAIQQRFAELRRQEYQISQRIANLESERSEHECVGYAQLLLESCLALLCVNVATHRTALLCCSLVLSVVSKMDGDRKCYQLIGGILVERSIEMVIPDLTYKREAVRSPFKCVLACCNFCVSDNYCDRSASKGDGSENNRVESAAGSWTRLPLRAHVA